MILQSLLEDKRFDWQTDTQKAILNNLLCKAHKYKSLGQKEDRLVMVFGKSHAGKTTFILTLMGVEENKLAELNKILRAGIPEGNSSTSTAIIYQHSDDNNFGFAERNFNDVGDAKVVKCDKESFIEYLQGVREQVEIGKYKNESVLYLYIPIDFFGKSENDHADISILDVPGYETTTENERYHTNAILNKYMSISVLNIVVRSIYDINDLQYFSAPNRDDSTKLLSGKYIIVTTRSYSQESIYKYFQTPISERKKSFAETIEEESNYQFKRIFGEKIPKVFLLDIGESFKQLISTKLKNQEDIDSVVNYRNSVFELINEAIYSKQSNSLVSWVQEVVEDEEFYGNNEINRVEDSIGLKKEALEHRDKLREEKERIIKSFSDNISRLEEQVEIWKGEKMELIEPDYDLLVDSKIERYLKIYFKSGYEWNVSKTERNVASHMAEIFSSVVLEYLEEITRENEGLVNEKEKQKFILQIEEFEYELKRNLEEKLNPHALFKILNPSNKEKVEIGIQELKKSVPTICRRIFDFISNKYEELITSCIKDDINPQKILLKENTIKYTALKKEIEKLEKEISKLRDEKGKIEKRIEKDKTILKEYRKIARECFELHREQIIHSMNLTSDKEAILSYILFLGLIEKDYKKVMME